MNDGNAPRRRSVFSYILPYLLIAATIGVFVYLIARNFTSSSETWAVSAIDDNVGYVVTENKEDGTKTYEWENYDSLDKKVISVEIGRAHV